MAKKPTIILVRKDDKAFEVVDLDDLEGWIEEYENVELYRVDRMTQVKAVPTKIHFEEVVKRGPKPKS